jgi:hypothetical protein
MVIRNQKQIIIHATAQVLEKIQNEKYKSGNAYHICMVALNSIMYLEQIYDWSDLVSHKTCKAVISDNQEQFFGCESWDKVLEDLLSIGHTIFDSVTISKMII